MQPFNIHYFKSFNDSRGSLLPVEIENLGIDPKRIFIVSNVPVNTIRGGHSHYKTKQFLICVSGIIEVILYDGYEEYKFILEENQGILIPELIWDSQKFMVENSMLLVICSTLYDKLDYIVDIDEYNSIVR